MEKQKKEIKYVMALYSNIALDNAQQYASINAEKYVESKSLKDHFILNEAWKILIKKINKKYQTNKEEKDIEKFIPKYLKLIRNFYSHPENSKKYGKNKEKNSKNNKEELEKLENSEDNIRTWILKSIMQNTPFLSQMDNTQKRLFFIILFLNSSEINELKEYLDQDKNKYKKIINIIDQKKNLYKHYSFRAKYTNRKIDINIHQKIVNYIKNFQKTKNYNFKLSFIKMAISLLNYHYKKNFKFKKLKGSEKFLIEIKDLKNKETKKIDFLGLKFLLLLNSEKHFFKIINEVKLKKLNNENNFKNKLEKNNYNSFKNRFTNESKITNRQLLKTFNRVIYYLYYENDNEKYNNSFFHQQHFELLFQSLDFNNLEYLDSDQNLKDKIEKLLNLKIENLNDAKELIDKIKKFVLNEINEIDKFKSLYKRKENIDSKNNKIQKDVNLYIHHKLLKEIFEEIKKNNKLNECPYDEKLFDFENINKKEKDEKLEKNKIKNYLAPIIMFYIKFFKNNQKNIEYVKINNNFLEQFKETIFKEPKIIKYIFDKKIPKIKYKIVIKNYYWLKGGEENLGSFQFEESFFPENLYEIINSKLFFAFWKLLFNDDEKIDKKRWEKIIKSINKHKNKEIELVKKYYQYDDKNNDYKKNEIRNIIMHRSINKFEKKEKYFKILNTLNKKIKIPSNK